MWTSLKILFYLNKNNILHIVLLFWTPSWDFKVRCRPCLRFTEPHTSWLFFPRHLGNDTHYLFKPFRAYTCLLLKIRLILLSSPSGFLLVGREFNVVSVCKYGRDYIINLRRNRSWKGRKQQEEFGSSKEHWGNDQINYSLLLLLLLLLLHWPHSALQSQNIHRSGRRKRQE